MTSHLPLPPMSVAATVRITQDYKAVREDEINIHKGDVCVLLDSRMEANKQEYIFIQREIGNRGWAPVCVIKDQGIEKKPWHMRLRKPSFTKKDSTPSKPNSLDIITARKDKGYGKVWREL